MSVEPGDRAIRVRLARSGREIIVPADRSILEVLLEEGFDIPSVCREGICGTCETRVLSGRPDHRDAILEEDEQESGKTMMICVSRALDDYLELDI